MSPSSSCLVSLTSLQNFSRVAYSTVFICSIVTLFPWISHYSLELTLVELLSLYWYSLLPGPQGPLPFQTWSSSLSLHFDLSSIWDNTSPLSPSISFSTQLPELHILLFPSLPFQLHLLGITVGSSSPSHTRNFGILGFLRYFFALCTFIHRSFQSVSVYNHYGKRICKFLSPAWATSFNSTQISHSWLSTITWMLIVG